MTIEITTMADKQAFWKDQLLAFEKNYWLPNLFEFLKFDMDLGNYVLKNVNTSFNAEQFDDSAFDNEAQHAYELVNTAWSMWIKAVSHMRKQLEGCVVVPLENARYFSNDGENYEIHETLEQAKHEAECAIEHYSERLADQEMDPTSDGNFHQIGYGVILAESTYSIDHVVTQEDIDNGDYSYEVGTQIMTLSLEEAARGGNDET